MRSPTESPAPRQLSDGERARDVCELLLRNWDDYRAAGSPCDILHPVRLALVGAMSVFSDESEHVARQYLSLLTALSTAREAGERDTARLDWLSSVMESCDDGVTAWRIIGLDPSTPTLRDAIDAARTPSTEPAR